MRWGVARGLRNSFIARANGRGVAPAASGASRLPCHQLVTSFARGYRYVLSSDGVRVRVSSRSAGEREKWMSGDADAAMACELKKRGVP